MFCENCGKEIGDRNECGYCGYDPLKDNADGDVAYVEEAVKPLEYKLKKQKNGKATAAFVLGFFNWYFCVTAIPCFILALLGLKQARLARKGHVKSILGLLSCIFWVGFYVFIIYLVIANPDSDIIRAFM